MQKQLHFKTLILSIVLTFFFQFSFGQGNTNPCAVNSCLNGGACNQLTDTYSCECTEFYFGSDCQFLKSVTLVAPSAPVVFKNDVNVPLDDAIQATGFSGGTYNVTASGLSNMTITFTITGGTLTLGTTDVVFGGGGNGSSSFTATGQAETVAFEDGPLNIALNQATFTPTPNLFGTNVASITFTAVYGPDYKTQIEVADAVKNILKSTTDVVDVDWMVEADQIEYRFVIDKQKAMLYGIAPQQIVHTLNMALSERPISNLYDEDASAQVGLILALEEKEKSTIQDISQLEIRSKTGTMISVGDLVDVQEKIRDKSIYHKNQKRVVYVMADMAGELESPVYSILGMTEKLNAIALPEGYSMNELYIKY